MSRARFATYTYKVEAIGRLPLDISGDTISCFEADGDLKIEFDNEGSVTDFKKGMTYPNEPFKLIELINESGSEIEVTISIGQGNIIDNRLSVAGSLSVQNEAGGTLQVEEAAATTLNDPVTETVIKAAASRVILAVNTDRKHCFVRNLSSLYTIYCGTAAVQDIPLAPNEVIDLSGTTYALYAVNNSAANIDVLIVEDE